MTKLIRLSLGLFTGWLAAIGLSPQAANAQSFRPPINFVSSPVISSILEPAYQGMRRFEFSYPYFSNKIPGLKKEVQIDSSRQRVVISHKLRNDDFFAPVELSFDEYLQLRLREQPQQLWREYVTKNLFSDLRKAQAGKGLGFDVPIPIKSQAFQKIFGGNTVGLQVVGNVTIDGGLRHEKRSEVKTAINRRSNFNFRMKQTQRFTVKGNVGQKVNVYVDQDSERPFEFDNAIRLEYKGFEDEVVESIEAGNVSLSLPASRFVTFNAKNSGLFGIKSNMRFGNLKLTMIASQEKGQKKKLSISGGASAQENRIDDFEYRAGTYFFLNYFYREQYQNSVDEKGIHLFDPSRSISRIEVYKSEDRYFNQSDAIYGWAIADPDGANPAFPDTSIVDQNHYKGYFRRLEQNVDYFVERDLGYIALERPIQKGEVLAVAYRDTSGNQVGDLTIVDPTQKKALILQLLRTKNPLASDYTWDLEWKNVYYLGTRNINKEGFELKIYFKPPSGDPQETYNKDGKPVSYLQIFGLDRRDLNGNLNPDNILDDDPNIINWARGELIFPDLEPFKLLRYKDSDKGLYDKRVEAIYDTTDIQYITQKSNFYIAVNTKVRETNYSLGFNVIEGSEEILLNGRKLVAGKDYIIDYFSGNLTLLTEEAADPNANLEISYESNQMIQIDRKTMLGARWDYELFNNSFIGGTFLYLNQSTLDQKIRIGQDGPMKNFVWNLNTALNFEPYFLTSGLNALPLIQTKEPSSVKFEGEIAQIIPNPNSRNNTATGDRNGVIYIDDFESALRETQLGVLRKMWTISSVPKIIPGWDEYNSLFADSLKNRSRGHLIWYNPYEQVAIKEIWPKRDVNPNVPQRVQVLNMRFNRNPLYGEHSWAGIMRYLPAGYADQTNSKFLEIWVRGDEGRLHIDFGQISEDAIPNGKLNTEDKAVGGIRNGILDPGEDTGLDGVAGKDGENVPGDAGNDDWFYDPNTYNYERINGTEGNSNDEGGRFPDTEDLNQNGSLDLRNDYFEYSFSLDKTHPDTKYIAGGLGLSPDEDYGWRMYRIPLADPDTVIGNPQWTNIEYVRIWVDGAPDDTIWVQIAEIKLTGSEWKERGIARSSVDTTIYAAQNDTTVRVTTVNTYDNPDYTPPPGVAGDVDPITKVVRKEQALVLDVTNLEPGYNGIIQKAFFQPQSYIDYRVMKMFVYGHDETGYHIQDDSTSIVFFFRFGADDRNYYEFRERVYPGWDERNEMVINLEKLTGLKNVGTLDERTGLLYGLTDDGDTLYVAGKPSLTNVRQLTMGVINYHDALPFTGQIWLNELRLTEVKKDKGMAMRARLDLKLADLMTLNAELNRVDDDFRTVNERFGKGNNQLSGTVNASLRLDRLLPQSLGLSIPVSLGYRNSESSPKYFPGSDIIVSRETATDSLLEAIKSKNKRKSLSVSIKKTTRSRNPLIKYTLDGLSLSYSYAEAFRSNSIIKQAKNFTYTGNLNYVVNFDPKAHIKPFSWMGEKGLFKPISSLELFYLPRTFNYRYSFNRTKDNTLNRNGLVTDRYNFVINQSLSTGFQPFRGFSLDYTYARVNDLREIDTREEMAADPLNLITGNLGPLTSLRQSFRFQYSPNLANWLKVNLSASTNFDYRNNIQQKELGKSAANNLDYSASINFSPNILLQKFTRRRPAATPPRRTIPRRRTPEEAEKEEKKEPEKKKRLPSLNPLRLLALFGQKIQPISFRYSQKISSNNYGLKEIPPFAFQIGKTFNPGEVVSQNVGSNRGSFSRSYSMDGSTGMNLTNNIKLSLKYNYSNSWNRTTTVTGNVSDTRWRLGDKNIVFPDWTLRWSGLEKLPFINKFVQRANLDHARNGRFVNKWLDQADNVTSEAVTAAYRPLIGLNMTLKNGMNCTVQFNQSFSENINTASGSGGTRKKTDDINVTIGYAKSGGFNLPIPFLSKKRIKNNVDFSLTFVKSSDISEQKRGQSGTYQEWTRNEKWSFTPRLSYSFSSTVTGGMRLEVGKTKNKLYGETRVIEFGINVNIRIAGR